MTPFEEWLNRVRLLLAVLFSDGRQGNPQAQFGCALFFVTVLFTAWFGLRVFWALLQLVRMLLHG